MALTSTQAVGNFSKFLSSLDKLTAGSPELTFFGPELACHVLCRWGGRLGACLGRETVALFHDVAVAHSRCLGRPKLPMTSGPLREGPCSRTFTQAGVLQGMQVSGLVQTPSSQGRISSRPMQNRTLLVQTGPGAGKVARLHFNERRIRTLPFHVSACGSMTSRLPDAIWRRLSDRWQLCYEKKLEFSNLLYRDCTREQPTVLYPLVRHAAEVAPFLCGAASLDLGFCGKPLRILARYSHMPASQALDYVFCGERKLYRTSCFFRITRKVLADGVCTVGLM